MVIIIITGAVTVSIIIYFLFQPPKKRHPQERSSNEIKRLTTREIKIEALLHLWKRDAKEWWYKNLLRLDEVVCDTCMSPLKYGEGYYNYVDKKIRCSSCIENHMEKWDENDYDYFGHDVLKEALRLYPSNMTIVSSLIYILLNSENMSSRNSAVFVSLQLKDPELKRLLEVNLQKLTMQDDDETVRKWATRTLVANNMKIISHDTSRRTPPVKHIARTESAKRDAISFGMSMKDNKGDNIDYTKWCERCINYNISFDEGIVCGLTNQKPDFLDECSEFVLNPEIAQQQADKEARLAREEARLAREEKKRRENNPEVGDIIKFISIEVLGSRYVGGDTHFTSYQMITTTEIETTYNLGRVYHHSITVPPRHWSLWYIWRVIANFFDTLGLIFFGGLLVLFGIPAIIMAILSGISEIFDISDSIVYGVKLWSFVISGALIVIFQIYSSIEEADKDRIENLKEKEVSRFWAKGENYKIISEAQYANLLQRSRRT